MRAVACAILAVGIPIQLSMLWHWGVLSGSENDVALWCSGISGVLIGLTMIFMVEGK